MFHALFINKTFAYMYFCHFHFKSEFRPFYYVLLCKGKIIVVWYFFSCAVTTIVGIWEIKLQREWGCYQVACTGNVSSSYSPTTTRTFRIKLKSFILSKLEEKSLWIDRSSNTNSKSLYLLKKSLSESNSQCFDTEYVQCFAGLFFQIFHFVKYFVKCLINTM